MTRRHTTIMQFAWLAGMLLATRLPAQKATHTPCESVQLRFVDETAPHAPQRYRDASTGKSYALRPSPVLDGHGIQNVYAEPFVSGRDTVWTVVAAVQPAMVNTLSMTTSKHVGEHTAVLVGHEIVQIAVLAGPVHSKVALRIQASKPIADSLVRRVRAAIAPGCLDR